MTRKSQPLVRQEAQTEVLDEVVLKEQKQELEACMVGCPEPGPIWRRSGTLSEVLLSPLR